MNLIFNIKKFIPFSQKSQYEDFFWNIFKEKSTFIASIMIIMFILKNQVNIEIFI